MPASFMEAVADRMVAVFQADFAAKLAAIDATLPDIVEYIKGERPSKGVYPTAWVHVEEAVPELQEEVNQLVFPMRGLWTHAVDVTIAITDPDDADALREKLYRYGAAAIQTVVANDPDDEWARARVRGVSLSPTMLAERETLHRKDVVIRVEVSRND